MKFGFDWPSSFGEEDPCKWWTDGGRTNDRPWLYYKLTNEPKGSGELKDDVKTFKSTLTSCMSIVLHPLIKDNIF